MFLTFYSAILFAFLSFFNSICYSILYVLCIDHVVNTVSPPCYGYLSPGPDVLSAVLGDMSPTTKAAANVMDVMPGRPAPIRHTMRLFHSAPETVQYIQVDISHYRHQLCACAHVTIFYYICVGEVCVAMYAVLFKTVYYQAGISKYLLASVCMSLSGFGNEDTLSSYSSYYHLHNSIRNSRLLLLDNK